MAAIALIAAAQVVSAGQARKPEDRARDVVELLAAGKYNAVEQQFAQVMKNALPAGGLMMAVAPEMKRAGAYEQCGKASVQAMGEHTVVIIPAYFEKGGLVFTISFDPSWQIDGLYFKPGEKPKQAAEPSASAASAAGAKSPFAAPAPASTKTPEERAREAVTLLLEEKYDALYAIFTPKMQGAITAEALKTKVGASIKSLGKLQEFGKPSISKSGEFTVVVLPAKFEMAPIDFTVSVDQAGLIGGLFMRPGQAPVSDYQHPAYSKPETFVEREVTVGSGEWRLPGTLTLPKAQKPAAAVVLVHGSGPNDRDETVMANRPFRDLAEGLASAGIAVLRYDKRTKVYGAKIAGMKNLTVQEETVEDAVLAAGVLRGQPEVDPKRVVVLGHSLGAYLLPMILQQDAKIAGGIGMAGTARPLEDVVLEQVEYLAPIQTAGQSDEVKAQAQKQLEQIRQQVAAIKALKPGQEDGPNLLGMPPHYLLALRDYDAPAMAASLKAPLLILQGERDYQVSMNDFAKWKAALSGRKDVELKSYPALNHLFMEGTGRSTPAEYSKAGHVAGEVITDIARWIGGL